MVTVKDSKEEIHGNLRIYSFYPYIYKCIWEFYGDKRLSREEVKKYIARWNIPKQIRNVFIDELIFLNYLKEDEGVILVNKNRLRDPIIREVIYLKRNKVSHTPGKYNCLF